MKNSFFSGAFQQSGTSDGMRGEKTRERFDRETKAITEDIRYCKRIIANHMRTIDKDYGYDRGDYIKFSMKNLNGTTTRKRLQNGAKMSNNKSK